MADPFIEISDLLAAARSSLGEEIAIHYAARARIQLEAARARLDSLELNLRTLEAELTRRGARKE